MESLLVSTVTPTADDFDAVQMPLSSEVSPRHRLRLCEQMTYVAVDTLMEGEVVHTRYAELTPKPSKVLGVAMYALIASDPLSSTIDIWVLRAENQSFFRRWGNLFYLLLGLLMQTVWLCFIEQSRSL